MGSGRWSNDSYTRAATARAASGTSAFAYTDRARSSGDIKVHADLDPKQTAGAPSAFAGQIMRESLDSTEHPNTVPVAVFFDVTGSMSSYPMAFQQVLPSLHAHLDDRVDDVQIMFGAIGDAVSDRVPLQVSHFESDNRMDDHLGNILLEGGGGGGNHESYELAAYFLARHTHLDAVGRGKKGYAFIVGDERAYGEVNANEVRKVLGAGFQGTITTEDIFAEASQKYELYFVSVNNGYRSQNDQYWKDIVGDDHYLTLDAPGDLVKLIGDTVVSGEGAAKVSAPLSTPAPATTTP